MVQCEVMGARERASGQNSLKLGARF